MQTKQASLYSAKAIQNTREYCSAMFETWMLLFFLRDYLDRIIFLNHIIDHSRWNRKNNRVMQFLWNFFRKILIMPLDVSLGVFTIFNIPLPYIILSYQYIKSKIFNKNYINNKEIKHYASVQVYMREELFILSYIFSNPVGPMILYNFFKMIVPSSAFFFLRNIFLCSCVIDVLYDGILHTDMSFRIFDRRVIKLFKTIGAYFHNFTRPIIIIFQKIILFIETIRFSCIALLGFFNPLLLNFNVLFYAIYHRNNIYDALKPLFNVSTYKICCAYITLKIGLFLDKTIECYYTLHHMFFTKPHTHIKSDGYHTKFLKWVLKNNVVIKNLTEDMVNNKEKLDELYMDVQEVINNIAKDPMQRPFYILLSGGNLYNIIDIINNFNNGFGMSRFAHNDYTSMSSQQYQGFKNKSELDFSKTDVQLLANRAKFLKNSGNKEYIELGEKLEDMIVYHLSDKKIENKYLRTLKSIIDDLYSNSNRFSDINGDKTLELHNRYQKLMDEVDKDAPIQAKHLKSLNVLGGVDKRYRLERVMNLAFRKKSLNLYSNTKKTIKYEDDGYCLASLHSIFSPLLANYISNTSRKVTHKQPLWRRQAVSHVL